MKILYTNFHVGAGISGHTVYLLRLAQALASRHQVSIATPSTSALYRLGAEMPGVAVHAQDFPNRLVRIPAERARLRALLDQGQFDIVHVNGSSDHRLVMLACLGMRRRPRIVLTKHNDMRVSRAGALVRARLATDHVIAVCAYVADLLARTPYRARGVTTVYNGIDTDYFSPFPQAASRRLRERWIGPGHDETLLVGSNAGTGSYKAWIDMVRAVSRLPEGYRSRIHIAIAGNPPDAEFLDEIASLGMTGQVHHAGRLDDVRPLVAAFDLGFVLSYRVETISFACREMMAMGKPVIVTRHAGLPENIDEGRDGWVVPVRDPDALSRLLRRILDGEFSLSDMGRHARQKSERDFGLRPFIEGTDEVYRGLVADDAGRSRHAAATHPSGRDSTT
jgi:glycosyltransferase involved in cell wall biosynthesis